MVTVTSATPTGPTVFPLIPCGPETGDMVSIGCLAIGFTPASLTFTWNKNGTDLTDFIQYPPEKDRDTYMEISQIRVRQQDWDAGLFYQCAVSHPAGKAQTLHITKPQVFYQLPSLKVLASSDETSYSCFANDFSPKDFEIKWLKDDQEITSNVTEVKTLVGERKLKNGTKVYNVASFLTFPSNEGFCDSKFKCEFKGKDDKGDVFTNSSVITITDCSGDIHIEGPKLEDIFLHQSGTVKCQVKGNKISAEKVYWEDINGEEIHPPKATPSTGKPASNSLKITYDEWINGVKFVCVVVDNNSPDPLKKVYERKIGGDVQRPSVYMLPPVEHTRTNTVILTCYVKDFFPQEFLVSWLVNDEAADSKYKISTTSPVEGNGSYYAYGQLSLDIDEWKNNDMVYSCVVYHQSVVSNTKAIVRSIGHSTFEKTTWSTST